METTQATGSGRRGNAPAESMEVGEAGAQNVVPPIQVQTAKRKNVDELGNEVPDSKRNRAVPEKNVKMNVFKLILHWHEYLRYKFNVPTRYNIDEIANLTSICSTIHTKFHQDTNGVGSLKDRITDDFEFTAVGNTLKYSQIGPTMKQIASVYGFRYQATEEDRKKLGTLSSILVLVVGYRSRFNEVRLGNTSITLKKMNDQEYEMELHRFGLNNTHCCLLHGCRYNPSLQSSMKQALGPMTTALNLCMNQDPKYAKSWKDAFCQAFKLVTGHEDIANTISGTRTKHAAILRQLADIGLFGVTRTSNKAFIPVALLLTSFEKRCPGYMERFAGAAVTLVEIPDAYLPPNIVNIDFSGHGLLHFWNSCSAFAFYIHGDPEILNGADASQMLFHAVMGTHKDNLNLLRWMTDTPFKTRRELGDVFRGRATSGKQVKLQIITYKKFSKMASAAQIDLVCLHILVK